MKKKERKKRNARYLLFMERENGALVLRHVSHLGQASDGVSILRVSLDGQAIALLGTKQVQLHLKSKEQAHKNEIDRNDRTWCIDLPTVYTRSILSAGYRIENFDDAAVDIDISDIDFRYIVSDVSTILP